jgi:hypothetical protein
VENFLEATDHDHLGKLITYASGLEGSYAVLIARTFRPEHRSALKWLNDISTSDAGFFGIELHAVRIGASAPAVRCAASESSGTESCREVFLHMLHVMKWAPTPGSREQLS